MRVACPLGRRVSVNADYVLDNASTTCLFALLSSILTDSLTIAALPLTRLGLPRHSCYFCFLARSRLAIWRVFVAILLIPKLIVSEMTGLVGHNGNGVPRGITGHGVFARDLRRSESDHEDHEYLSVFGSR